MTRTLAFLVLTIVMATAVGTRVVFENPVHDFPQRIIYWKDGADLRARIEGTQKGKEGSMEWRWSSATPNQR